MKTTVRLGVLQIIVEADDVQELVRQAWEIYRLNEAATQEGLSVDEVMPFSETGADENEYAGFVILTPPGGRINFGHTKNGKRWYPRMKGMEHYKGISTYGAGDPSRQLPEHNERPQVGGKAQQKPGRQEPKPAAKREAHPAGADQGEDAGATLTQMMKELNAAKGDPDMLDDALSLWDGIWDRIQNKAAAQTARANWDRFSRILQDLLQNAN